MCWCAIQKLLSELYASETVIESRNHLSDLK